MKKILISVIIIITIVILGILIYNLMVNKPVEKQMTTAEMLETYKVDHEIWLGMVINDILNNITTDYLLESTDGDVTANQIKVTDIKNNQHSYFDKLYKNNYQDVLTLSVKDNKLICTYRDDKVLEKMNLSSHMGNGLKLKYVDIVIR